jgi:hypothetical protein
MNNLRNEIPDWFFDHCYVVNLNRVDNSVICHCSDTGYDKSECNGEYNPGRQWTEDISLDTWKRWQAILLARPGFDPREGWVMASVYREDSLSWWLRVHNGLCYKGHDPHCTRYERNLREFVFRKHSDVTILVGE